MTIFRPMQMLLIYTVSSLFHSYTSKWEKCYAWENMSDATKCTKSVFTNVKIGHFLRLECLTEAPKAALGSGWPPGWNKCYHIKLISEDQFCRLPLSTCCLLVGNAVATRAGNYQFKVIRELSIWWHPGIKTATFYWFLSWLLHPTTRPAPLFKINLKASWWVDFMLPITFKPYLDKIYRSSKGKVVGLTPAVATGQNKSTEPLLYHHVQVCPQRKRMLGAVGQTALGRRLSECASCFRTEQWCSHFKDSPLGLRSQAVWSQRGVRKQGSDQQVCCNNPSAWSNRSLALAANKDHSLASVWKSEVSQLLSRDEEAYVINTQRGEMAAFTLWTGALRIQCFCTLLKGTSPLPETSPAPNFSIF